MKLFENPDLAYCEIDGTLIFLDIARDRYICLPEPNNSEALLYLNERGFKLRFQTAAYPQPSVYAPPVMSSPAISAGPFRIADTARAVWVQRRTEKRLASRSFQSILIDLGSILDSRASASAGRGGDPTRTIRAFEYARLLRTAADRCLSRSIALALCLASDSERANVVFGVKLSPFGAHCWVQKGTDVLNDSVEEVLRYQPILVI